MRYRRMFANGGRGEIHQAARSFPVRAAPVLGRAPSRQAGWPPTVRLGRRNSPAEHAGSWASWPVNRVDACNERAAPYRCNAVERWQVALRSGFTSDATVYFFGDANVARTYAECNRTAYDTPMNRHACLPKLSHHLRKAS